MRVAANVALDALRKAKRPLPIPTASDVDPAEAAVTRLALAEALREQRVGVAVHELTPQPPSLEAAFLDLTHDAAQFRALGSST
jgi:DNA-directed RNA polymerase specialized sigma24 family protein